MSSFLNKGVLHDAVAELIRKIEEVSRVVWHDFEATRVFLVAGTPTDQSLDNFDVGKVAMIVICSSELARRRECDYAYMTYRVDGDTAYHTAVVFEAEVVSKDSSEGHRSDLTDYHECIKIIEEQVKQFTVDQLEEINSGIKPAGVTCLKWENFQETCYKCARTVSGLLTCIVNTLIVR
jgi:hypothetical protein